MADLLDIARITRLPQPLCVREFGAKDWWCPVHDIDVETGLYRIDVMGKLEIKHIGGAAEFRDADGRIHTVDDFYLESTTGESQ